MTVKLVWATPNGDTLVARMARVSNPANQNNPDSAKLISYLIKHKHWSPLEMVSACMEVETTRDIGRQILRHRSFSFQEFSQRYADVNALDVPFKFRECRMQDHTNRQNSIQLDLSQGKDREVNDHWALLQQQVLRASREAYADALANGIAKEQARALLPEGMTKSRMYMSGTLRSWLHFVDLRKGVETQREHREIALDASEILYQQFPHVMEAFNAH
jgi:thymidylate synthase (FAD)